MLHGSDWSEKIHTGQDSPPNTRVVLGLHPSNSGLYFELKNSQVGLFSQFLSLSRFCCGGWLVALAQKGFVSE